MPPKNKLRPGERLFALTLVLFAGFVFFESYGISGLKGLTTGGVMPMIASGVMVISGLFILVDTLRRPVDPGQGIRDVVIFLLPLRVVLFGALLVAYAIAIPYTGFLAASGALLVIAIWSLWHKGPLWAIGISALSVAAIYLLFRIVFQVVLPTGSLWS